MSQYPNRIVPELIVGPQTAPRAVPASSNHLRRNVQPVRVQAEMMSTVTAICSTNPSITKYHVPGSGCRLRRRREDKSVRTAAADQPIGAVAAGQGVVAVTSLQHVVTCKAVQEVCAIVAAKLSLNAEP